MMRVWYQMMFILSLIFISVIKVTGQQSVIINELSQGPSGNKEYIELLVIGDASAPFGDVNLTGFLIDDNNGSFSGSVGTGVSAGHLRLTSCFIAVPVGSIILIYNAADKNPAITLADDPTDANKDSVYVIPSNSTCLEYSNTVPNATTPVTTYTTGSYTATTLSAWNNSIAFNNSGDAVQVRDYNGVFYHGFSYGTTGAPYPTFPSGASSFNLPVIGGTNGVANVFALDCGSWEIPGTYRIGTTATLTETPGFANTVNNALLIKALREGYFGYNVMYTKPTIGCPTILPYQYFNIRAENFNNAVKISWDYQYSSPALFFYVEKYINNKFENIGSINASNSTMTFFFDKNPEPGKNIYRIKVITASGETFYTPVEYINIKAASIKGIRTWPTIVTDKLNIELYSPGVQLAKLLIHSIDGKKISTQTILLHAGKQIKQIKIPANIFFGSYIITMVFQDNEIANSFFVKN